jgi:hypothetical protein
VSNGKEPKFLANKAPVDLSPYESPTPSSSPLSHYSPSRLKQLPPQQPQFLSLQKNSFSPTPLLYNPSKQNGAIAGVENLFFDASR